MAKDDSLGEGMSNTLNEFLEKITFESNWTPSVEDMMEFYSEASKTFIADSLHRGYRDQDKIFLNLLLRNNNIFIGFGIGFQKSDHMLLLV